METLHPNERVEAARNQLGMAQLKIAHGSRRGALAPDGVAILSQRIGWAQEQLNLLPRYPTEQPAEAEVFFAGATLEQAVLTVIEALAAAQETVEPLPKGTIDRAVRHLTEFISDAELQRLAEG